jgi:hypothetical protein
MGLFDDFEPAPPPDELLRYCVEFSAGRKASNFGGMLAGTTFSMSASADEEPDPATEIRLVPGAFVCQWPKRGIYERRVEADAAEIRAASERAVELWPAA